MPLIDLTTRLAKLQCITFVLTAISVALLFFATVTPSWQVAEDLDVGREVQSGLWIYCPGTGLNCWYIFSDDVINYYEKVDVCRFLLIGDCRQKLLRTPYFFGWHTAVLILMLTVLLLGTIAMVGIAIAYFKPQKQKVATIAMVSALGFGFILLCIALAVFMINAAMLESKYLIGVQNTFPKEYGYSFYVACLGLTVMMFAVLAAAMCSTYTFFMRPETHIPDRAQSYVFDARGNLQPSSYNVMKPVAAYNVPQYSPSEASTLHTRTFISY